MSTPATKRENGDLHDQPAYEAVRDFLYFEARLLDEQRWREWADLFTENGDYWVPVTPSQPDPYEHVSLIYETPLLREIRIRRFEHPNAHSLQPFPRSVHLLSNVMVDSVDAESGETRTNARFLMIEYRKQTQRIYAGSVSHWLMASADGYKIRRKRVDLVNCDDAHETINLYF